MLSRLAPAAVLLFLVFSASGSARVVGGSESGAFPGRNGEILFTHVPSGQQWQLDVMRPDGTNQRRLTWANGNEENATWSPNGEWIAYDNGGGRTATSCQLYVIRVGGTQRRRLTHDRWCDEQPAWSPDGKRIVFSRNRLPPQVSVAHAEHDAIWTINLNGTGLQRLTDDQLGWATSPVWSPDGTTIACVVWNPRHNDTAIWLMDPDGSNQRQLTPTSKGSVNDEETPDWSPDGNWIAFSRDQTYVVAPQGTTDRNDIHLIRPDGTGLRQLTRRAGQNRFPAWSPDGKRIAFVSVRVHTGRAEVYVMNADGTQQKRLTTSSADERSPDWRPRP